MAGTLQEFCGLQLSNKDADHISGTAASAVCSIVTSPNGPWSIRCLQITPSQTVALYRAGNEYTFTPTGTAVYTLAAFYVRVDGVTPPPAANPAANLVAIVDENSTPFIYVRLDDAFNLELFDSTDTLLDFVAMTAGTWKRIIFFFQPNDATGDWWWSFNTAGDKIVRNGGSVFGGTDGQGDFSVPTGTKQAMVWGGQGGAQPVPGGNMDCQFGGSYMKDAVETLNDIIGVNEGKTGDFHSGELDDCKIDLASVTPECDESGTTTETGVLRVKVDADTGYLTIDNGDHKIVHLHRVDVSWSGGSRTGMLVDITEGGTLTTRTDDDTGDITLADAGHLFSTSHIVDVTWAGGSREAMDITGIAGAVITVDDGSGDVLPAATTAVSCTVINRIIIDGGAGDDLPAATEDVVVDRLVDDLDGGTTPDFADAGDANLVTFCSYTNNPGGFHQGGAAVLDAPASLQMDFPAGFKWIYAYKGTGMSGVYGVFDPATSTFTVEKSDAFRASAVLRYERIIWDTRLDLGSTGTSFLRPWGLQSVQGLYGVGGGKAARDVTLFEAYCTTLNAIPIISGRADIGKTGNVSRGKRRWH